MRGADDGWVVDARVVDGSLGEDAASVEAVGDALVLVVADGAGGTSGGAAAAAAVIEAAEGRAFDSGEGWAALLGTLDSELAGVGETTAVIVQVLGDRIVGASVGDSEAWLFGPEAAVELSAGQRRKPLLGSGRASPISFEATLGPDVVLLLGTDGLFDYAARSGIEAAARGAGSADDLVALARLPSGGLQDDIAVIVCRRETRPKNCHPPPSRYGQLS